MPVGGKSCLGSVCPLPSYSQKMRQLSVQSGPPASPPLQSGSAPASTPKSSAVYEANIVGQRLGDPEEGGKER